MSQEKIVECDGDVAVMDEDELMAEVMKLRKAIRLHRDEKGHDRCWLDDQRLYEALPETKPADFTLPPKDEFLVNCERYWECRGKQST